MPLGPNSLFSIGVLIWIVPVLVIISIIYLIIKKLSK
jgi:hypothetical protein